jgi:hypothetical protein
MATPMQQRGESAPEITTVDDLLKKMRQGCDAVHEIKMRGLTIPIRLLSQDEWNQLRRTAKMEKEAHGWDETDYNVRLQRFVLLRSCEIKPGTPGILSEMLMAKLTTEELGFLYSEYIRVNDLVNPNIEVMNEEQFRVIVDSLKKNNISSRDLSLPQLREICTAFVDLIQRLEDQQRQMDNSSGGPRPTSP